MLEIYVAQDKTGDFVTITEAVNSVPYGTTATIFIAAGVYCEKIFCEKKNLILIGAGTDQTVLTWNDGGKQPHCDGRKKGTFRSYSIFLGGEHITVKNLTISNTAGDGRIVGQAIAAYVDADTAYFENVHLLGRQDTLFCAPLPLQEREENGFLGPRHLTARKATAQYYKNCFISGDVDFIFGGADAVFDTCEIFSYNRDSAVNGYVAAPCTPAQGIGFIFINCHFTSNCPPHSVYLARPWRSLAKAAFLNCCLDAHIHSQGFAGWGDVLKAEPETTFVECESSGAGACSARVAWAAACVDKAALLANIKHIKKAVLL
ncbi:MAG: pectinesterase family protein [Oscillospiraceae bacterium]|nr:pectinesterase family protein [Oscillospiraceae bacterium]